MKSVFNKLIFMALIFALLLLPNYDPIGYIIKLYGIIGTIITYSLFVIKNKSQSVSNTILLYMHAIIAILVYTLYYALFDEADFLLSFCRKCVVIAIITLILKNKINSFAKKTTIWALSITITIFIMMILIDYKGYISLFHIYVFVRMAMRMIITVVIMLIIDRAHQIKVRFSYNTNHCVLYCPKCAQTGANLPDATRHPEYYKGYIYTQNKKERFCQYCGTQLQDTGMNWEEVDNICNASNADRSTLKSLIELKHNNKKEYNIKYKQLINSITTQ